MDFLLICPFLLALLLPRGSFADLEKQRVDSGLEIYKKLFEVKRKDQMNALKNLIELNDVNQQYKIIDIMLKGLFKVLEDSRAVLIAADVPPDGPFPQDEKIKDAYSHVVENTAFFGDVVLRFPKIVHHYFDRNSNWNSLIRWGIGFCNLTGVFEQGPHSQVLGLMAQELGISEKSPDYRNPFKTDHSECRHLPEGTAGGREAEEEGGEAEGDPQGPAHLPLAVGAVAGGGLRLAAGATPAGRGAALSLLAASGRCLVVVPFPFVPWILFRCLSLSLSGGWGKLRWGTPEPKHRREGSGAVPWAGQSAATHGGVGRGGHTAAEPRGEPGSPPFCSTGCSTLNVPPPSWVGWGAHHAKQPHDQCCFS
ncbi:coiled-coil domain-containing protein 134 isoform X1 [Egretta garzetta]|uniref:coiled-coil domain-containing protein 134 isoform X1 n=1 Tax=Egretta garzetta TaxID=188379 RepID=UPI00163C5926|nr:coiled-coil domain-containing protein 134 isoform X1 [Egretta garzetta]